jgi:hypothetical protein
MEWTGMTLLVGLGGRIKEGVVGRIRGHQIDSAISSALQSFWKRRPITNSAIKVIFSATGEVNCRMFALIAENDVD